MRKLPKKLKDDLGWMADMLVDWNVTDKGIWFQFDTPLSFRSQEELARRLGVQPYDVVDTNEGINAYHVRESKEKNMKTIEITEEIKIPQKDGTVFVLEQGDRIKVLNEKESGPFELVYSGNTLSFNDKRGVTNYFFRFPKDIISEMVTYKKFSVLSQFKTCVFYDMLYKHEVEAEFHYYDNEITIEYDVEGYLVRRKFELEPLLIEGYGYSKQT